MKISKNEGEGRGESINITPDDENYVYYCAMTKPNNIQEVSVVYEVKMLVKSAVLSIHVADTSPM